MHADEIMSILRERRRTPDRLQTVCLLETTCAVALRRSLPLICCDNKGNIHLALQLPRWIRTTGTYHAPVL